MDQETFQLLARFIIRSRKLIGTVDSHKLVSDPIYAASIFDATEAFADEDLMTLSLTLRHRLGQLQKVAAPLEEVIMQAVMPGPERNGAKYKFGARS